MTYEKMLSLSISQKNLKKIIIGTIFFSSNFQNLGISIAKKFHVIKDIEKQTHLTGGSISAVNFQKKIQWNQQRLKCI